MPRKNLIRTCEYFYHVATRSNHKEWFSLPLSEVWDISSISFQKAQKNNPAIVSQYVLMANHYHMLIRTPNADIDQFMYWFNKTFSDELRYRTGSENRMFGSNYKWSLITSDIYFKNVFRYIYQNPLRAGIVNRCEEYPYSTFHHTYFRKEIPFPFTPLSHLEIDNPLINYPFDSQRICEIRSGLKKTKFKIKKVF